MNQENRSMKDNADKMVRLYYNLRGFKAIEELVLDLINEDLKDVDTLSTGINLFQAVRDVIKDEDKIRFNALFEMYIKELSKQIRLDY